MGMTEQEKDKTLQGLQICSNDAGIPNQCEVFECPYHDGTLWCRHELAKDALKLIYELQETQKPIKPHIEHNLAGQPMEAQKPRMPHYTILRYIVEGNEVSVKHPECPKCCENGLVLWDAEIERGAAYCKRCGQAVRWE